MTPGETHPAPPPDPADVRTSPPGGAAPSGAAPSGAAPPAPAAPVGPLEILAAAAWIGIAGGVAECAAILLRGACISAGVHFDAHVFWMIPLAQMAVLVAAALVMVLVTRPVPRFLRLGPAVFVLVWPAVTSALLVFAPQLAKYASYALATGIAFHAARTAAARRDAFRRTVRRSLPWMVAATGAAACAVFASRGAARRHIGVEFPPAREGAPNVLLIVLDTVRAASLSAHGYSRDTTPRLAALAQRGTLFERCIAPAPWTLASHASAFTGRHPHELGVDFDTALDDTQPTIAELLGAQGYETGGFVANRWYCARGSGLARGFAVYEDFAVGLDQWIERPAFLDPWLSAWRMRRGDPNRVAGRAEAPDVSGAFLAWLDGLGDRPFFAFLNYCDAHDPYLPPAPFDTMFGVRRPKHASLDNRVRGAYTAERVAEYQAQYDGGIAYLDQEIAALLDDLRRRGRLENTVVIVTSDHGEEFAEHEVLEHAASLYMPSLHVPLIVVHPGRVPAGLRVAPAVELRNVGATVLDLAGASDAAARFPGASLARHWSAAGAPAPRPILSAVPTNANRPAWWPAGPAPLDSVLLDGWHYIRSRGTRPEELYHWDEDPWEQRDQARAPEHHETLMRCRAALDSLLAERSSPGE